MMNLETVDQILDFAIKNEEDAAEFYTNLASKMDKPSMKKVFEEFAIEEKEHKAKLLAVKKGKLMVGSEKKVMDLKLSNNLVEIKLDANLNYQDALIVAMKAEKAAYKLYNDLASAADDANLKSTLLNLAQEEAKHKLRFEIEYDDFVLTEN
ncbi:MAG: ferritin family protein [candidate division Zixibacteria bacterium]|nr:ferritin family protein [candidate division Zixibacteria bacterium]